MDRKQYLLRALPKLAAALFLFAIGYITLIVLVLTYPVSSSVCCASPADRGFGYETVKFSSSDGVILSGWYIPSQNRAAVILLHGYSADRRDMMEHADFLARQGYGVLLYDLRGHGESGGTLRANGWLDLPDVDAALNLLETRSDIDRTRIGILGFSIGGQIAIRAAAQNEKIKAVVVDGASTANQQDQPAARSLEDGLSNLFDAITLQGIAWRAGIASPPSVVEVIDRIAPRPILIIASADEAERQIARRYYELARQPKELWEITDAQHGKGIFAQPDEYKKRVGDLLDRALLTNRLTPPK